MAKGNGFGKFVFMCGVVGAAAAGAYYYMTQRDKALADDFDDDFDDFDDFDDAFENESDHRGYVDLGGEEKAEASSAKESDAEGEGGDEEESAEEEEEPEPESEPEPEPEPESDKAATAEPVGATAAGHAETVDTTVAEPVEEAASVADTSEDDTSENDTGAQNDAQPEHTKPEKEPEPEDKNPLHRLARMMQNQAKHAEEQAKEASKKAQVEAEKKVSIAVETEDFFDDTN